MGLQANSGPAAATEACHWAAAYGTGPTANAKVAAAPQRRTRSGASVRRMRKYLFGTGLFGAVTGGETLLRALRNDAPFTWRVALAWLSWAISLVLAIAAVVDLRNARRGRLAPPESPVSGHEDKILENRLKG
jgi:hypothetical protein